MEIRQSSDLELMDAPERSAGDLRENLRDLERMNRFLGAHAFVRRYLDDVLPVWRERGGLDGRPLMVLDVATGGADIPAAVVGWARRRRVPVRVVGIDRHPGIARIAGTIRAAFPAITVMQADACALPFRGGSFDVCLCHLALHHLTRDQGLALLRRLHNLARIGFLVIDLVRSGGGYGGVWLVTRFARDPITRHDGPLSVRRALSRVEYSRLASETGIPGIRVTRLPFFRVALSRIGPA
jgi:SAM-dependent methyltransferase